MPRLPRNCCETSFFHIIVQGLNKEYIFSKDIYIKQYLKLLNTYVESTNIKILAYCIMSNHAHFLVYTETVTEMSKFMQKINTKYAKYYNYMQDGRVGYVFRDRYRSEEIRDEKYLISCINYIHNNPKQANIVSKCEDYKYSSYSEYIRGDKIELLSDILNVKLDKELFINIDESCIFQDIEDNINKRIEFCMEEFIERSNFDKEEITKDNLIFKLLVKYLKNNCNIKYTEMIEYFKISRKKMEILKG